MKTFELLTEKEMNAIRGGAEPVKPVSRPRPNDYYDDEDGDKTLRPTK